MQSKECSIPCPFCGNSAILRIIDEYLQSNIMTAEICCAHCHYTGKIILSFECCGAVSEEVHNEIISKISAICNNWTERENRAKQLLSICDVLLELSCILEKGHAAAQYLVSDYFADHVKTHEKNKGVWLLHCYDNARTFSGIAADYYEQALQMTDRLMESIDSKSIIQ